MFYLMTHSTHFYLRLYGREEMFYLTMHSRHILFTIIWKEMFYLMTLLTHFIYDYMDGRKCFI